MRTCVWHGLDEPRMEIAYLDGERIRGTQIGVAYEVRYALEADRLRVEVAHGPAAEVELDGADFFDLGHSPLFNSLPVWAGLDAPRDYTMRWVEVPSLAVSESTQTYEPLAPGRVRFRSGSFEVVIAFDEDGLVTDYPGLAERVA